MGSDHPHVSLYIRSVRQAPKKLRNDNKVTPRKVYSWFALPEQFLETVPPTRAPRRGHGVDSRTLGWRFGFLHRWPLFRLPLCDSLRLLCGDSRRLLLGDSHRLLLKNFFASPRLFLHMSAVRRCFSARRRSHRSFIVIRPLEHRGPPLSSGLVATKRDAARSEGTSGYRLPLLLGQLVCRCSFSLDSLRYWG